MSIPHAPAAAPAALTIEESKFRRLLQRAENFRKAQQPEACINSLKSALQLKPDHVATLLQLAEMELRAERHNEARAATFKALEGHLETPKLALELVRMLGLLTESGVILQIARQLPPHMWDSATSLCAMALELSMIGAHVQAREFIRAALARDANHPPSLALAATIDVFNGDMKSAAEHGERCLQFLPYDSGTNWQLARLRLPDPQPRIERIQRALARNPSIDDQSRLAYGLHDEYHNIGDYDRAWEALQLGCGAMRQIVRYSRDHASRVFDALRSWSAEEVRAGDGHADDSLVPIFVIGLHRSGTTLAERILTGHSAVAAGGETYDIRAALRRGSGLHFASEIDLRVVAERQRLDYRSIGSSFLRGISWRANGLRLVTDKLPSNYFNVGFIARALPNARFIHLNRDPIDVGLSSLRTLFSHACPYSYDQGDYIHHYRGYRALMDHWRKLLPDRLLDIDYQDLVDQPQETAARMAAFCGLDFESGMVRIESRGDAVATASSVMMRDGIRRDRGRMWAKYERHLQPLIEAFPESA